MANQSIYILSILFLFAGIIVCLYEQDDDAHLQRVEEERLQKLLTC
uniref:Uncharacterized protein n=1 Tax=viral metagenome TaxID=1070528 RepID=A0A6C0C8Y3_9ZZZZ